jgi:hypothetical protein
LDDWNDKQNKSQREKKEEMPNGFFLLKMVYIFLHNREVLL